jgi:hypothetical protein
VSDELARRPDGGRPDWRALASNGGVNVTVNPLVMLPKDWRQPVSVVWMCNSHLLPSALPLCSSLRVYSERGITTDDVERICAQLLDPERRARHKFASDLIADLCGLVAVVIQRRAQREAAAERRAESDEFAQTRKTLGGSLFQLPEE